MFAESWFAAGLITTGVAADFAVYARRDPVKSKRHWQWMAFRDFVQEGTPLDAECCSRLFELGNREPDLNLGTAMMCAVLHQRWCPAEVKRDAANHVNPIVRRTLRFAPRVSQ